MPAGNLRHAGDRQRPWQIARSVPGRPRLIYAFKPSAAQAADVPFGATFRETMAVALRTAFPAFFKAAMANRR